jgi:hypothetical protein
MGAQKSRTWIYRMLDPRWVNYRPRVLGAVFIGARNHECPKVSKSRKCPQNRGPTEDPRGIDGRHWSDTNNFIRGLHGEYLVSWGQKNDLKVAIAIFGKELTQITNACGIEDD